MKKLPAFVVSLLIAAALLVLTVKIWLSGAAGCARVISGAVYTDEDELARTEPEAFPEAENPLSDAAYDAVFPDLLEPPQGE